MNIEDRIKALESKLCGNRSPGTKLSRVFKEVSGYHWCLGLGAMCMPLSFYYGETIEICLNQAEEDIRKGSLTKENVHHSHDIVFYP